VEECKTVGQFTDRKRTGGPELMVQKQKKPNQNRWLGFLLVIFNAIPKQVRYQAALHPASGLYSFLPEICQQVIMEYPRLPAGPSEFSPSALNFS